MKSNKQTPNQSYLERAAAPLLITSVLAATSVISVVANHQVTAQSANQLRERSAALQEQIEDNSARAHKLHKKANTLQEAVAQYDSEIAEAEADIAATSRKIAQLEKDLLATRAELDRQKELLKANILTLYKRGDATPVELIAGSEDFSGYIDEQEYLERIKLGIQESAKKVEELEKKLEEQRKQQKELLAKQIDAKKSLDDMRAQRARLMKQTRGEEHRYKSIVAGLEAKRAAVDRELTALIISQQYNNLGVVSGDGQFIGRVGSTGYSTGPHLHFEIRNSSGSVINPRGSMGAWPVSGYISQEFGCVAPYGWYYTKCANGNSLHPGLDIVASLGTPIVATKPGVIIFRGWDGAYGNKVVIKHGDGTFSVYAHLSSFN